MAVSFVTNYFGYIIVYGFGFGITSGIMYLVPLNTGFKYPIKKGIIIINIKIYINFSS